MGIRIVCCYFPADRVLELAVEERCLMSLVLDLPTELETKLAAEASRRGIGLPEYVVRLLATERSLGETPRDGLGLVAYWQAEGVIGSRPDIQNSQVHARALRRQAERRDQG